MKTCDTCGNHYEKAMRITVGGAEHWFDCFECAIHKLAPRCHACGVAVVGHGVEDDDHVYCSAHCARQASEAVLRDHAERDVPGPGFGHHIPTSALRELGAGRGTAR